MRNLAGVLYPEALFRLTFTDVPSRAENVLAMLQATSDASTKLYNSLPSETKGAFFQLVHHPIQATLTIQNMYYAAGLNNLRASQACLIANNYKTEVENLFVQDYDLEVEYHTILNGTSSPLGITRVSVLTCSLGKWLVYHLRI